GVAAGNGKGKIFQHGEVITTVPENQIVDTLVSEAHRMAAELDEGGAPEVTVS
ncbi:MAG: 4-hydroxy-3-methylbut-2-en-1-yl diphosphate synthase, partial [Cutibacterium granulosum]|nr:4-hydroxy-3-methylbut-2-en-1-yl diphosphate synthase [Cutibacterium granulosum]